MKNIASKVNSGKTPLGGEAVYKNEGVLFIRSQNVSNNRLDLENPVFISEEINEGMKNSVVYPNDILLNITGASLGRSCVVPEDFKTGNVNQHVCIIRLIKNNNPRFLQPYFFSGKGQNTFKSLQTGSGREGLNFESIKKLKLFIPSVSEQNKIADFLASIDLRIQAQNEIIGKYESLMQGFGQKLFNKQLRFKNENGQSFPNWESKRIEDLCIKKSSNISANKIEDNFGKYKIFGASGILKRIDFYAEEKDFISIVKDGAGVGRLFYCSGKSSVLGTLDIIKPGTNINTRFLFYLLNTIDFTKYITGSTIPHIYFKDYKSEKRLIPSLEEQNKIALFLSNISEKIQGEKNILDSYIGQKQYLLQQLFI